MKHIKIKSINDTILDRINRTLSNKFSSIDQVKFSNLIQLMGLNQDVDAYIRIEQFVDKWLEYFGSDYLISSLIGESGYYQFNFKNKPTYKMSQGLPEYNYSSVISYLCQFKLIAESVDGSEQLTFNLSQGAIKNLRANSELMNALLNKAITLVISIQTNRILNASTIEGNSFKNYHTNHPALLNMHSKTTKYVQAILCMAQTKEPLPNLMIKGPIGIGKTHCSNAILNSLKALQNEGFISNDFTIYKIKGDALFANFTNNNFDTAVKREKVKQEIISADVLLVDDVFKDRRIKNELKIAIISEILTQRYESGLATILNLNNQDVIDLDHHVMDRFGSRLAGYIEIEEYSIPSYRQIQGQVYKALLD